MAVDDIWKQQAESFGRYLRTQRKLADLSLRELAAMTDVSNAYLSQLERGQHQPSVRVLRALADALDVTARQMVTQAGLIDDDAGTAAADAGADAEASKRPAGSRSLTEGAILADPQLSDEQKQALLAVYHNFLGVQG
ncbi:MAG: helix-turn-helix domain-containing protein [Acidimicrobiales bacterium]